MDSHSESGNSMSSSSAADEFSLPTVNLVIPSTSTDGSCHICGGPNAKPHYGAIACNGCKSFFRRSIWHRRIYHCTTGKNACVVNAEHRNNCQSCRLDRCISQGMDAMAIQCDRVEKKTASSSRVSVRELMQTHARKKADACHAERSAHQAEWGAVRLSTPEDTSLPSTSSASSDIVLIEGSKRPSRVAFSTRLQLFLHSPVVQYLVDQDHFRDELANIAPEATLDEFRLLCRTDVPFEVACAEPGRVAVRTRPRYHARNQLVSLESLVFILTRCFTFTMDWLNLIPDLHYLFEEDRQQLLLHRFIAVCEADHIFKAHGGEPSEDILFIDGSYYPAEPELRKKLPDTINTYFDEVAMNYYRAIIPNLRELSLDRAEACLIKAIMLFTPILQLSPVGRGQVAAVREKFSSALYTHVRQTRVDLSARQAAARVARLLLLIPLFERLAHAEDEAIMTLAIFEKNANLRGLPYQIASKNIR